MATKGTGAAAAATVVVPRCDICLGKDGWKGMRIQKCQACGVRVHEECYGLDNSTKNNSQWKCWPCQAVGTEIQGHSLRTGKLKSLKQTTRPTECALCAVKDGFHAMHALYHDHGEDGRQAILPKGGTLPQRLAWVHSLCALTVCSHRGTQGSVYGCDENGDYEGDGLIHHFAMVGLSKDSEEEDAEWIKMLNDHRTLRCIICGQHETSAGRNLRVPLQCCAGDDDEYPEFKKHHGNIGDPCTQALHVGCAAWGFPNERPQCRRMWFYPGSNDEQGVFQKPVTEIFCDLHARQMNATAVGIIRGTPVEESTGGLLKYTHDDGTPKPRASAVLPSYTSPSVERRASQIDQAPKKKQGTVTSKAASVKRPGEVAKTSQSSKTKSSTAKTSQSSKTKSHTTITGSKAKSTSLATVSASIPRKKTSSSSSKAVAAPGATPPQTSSTSSIPNNAASSKASSKESAITSTQKPTKATAAHSLLPLSGKGTKDKYTAANQSTKHASGIESSALKRTQTEHTEQDVEGRSTKHVNDSERAIPLLSPPKRKRIRNISEEKQSDEERRQNGRIESKQDGNIWINEDVDGLVEKEELPVAGAPPDGANPWAALWEPGAKPFELEVIESAERKNMDNIS